ncbi:MAG: hypothetical protein F6K54_12395 [Okeania sp. SIO3B5]|uniref:hypothetical protein n=1 Tax=Okeania sp. SIO3B5 TaxID=2607811 RepID=UPI0014007D6B|nr:hypothetical protein [Okeania sp. SIO3B5]NEO53808.1 hypothetical protein [Okeania sp. SIO3B5]
MATYTLKISSSSEARQAAAAKGYNFILAKGVSSGGGDPDYNTAWIVLKPNEMTGTDTITWTDDYYANFSTQEFKNKAKIVGSGNDVKMTPGGEYNLDKTGDLITDPNKEPNGTAFHFHNDEGYALEYVPILKSLNNLQHQVPIWSASTGVTKNGAIDATPVTKVRVWLGKYEQGEAVLAEYATIAVEFDLTTIFSGEATINDDLSDWTPISDNAKTIEPNLADTNEFFEEVDLITVTTTFTTALTVVSVGYLTNKFLSLFDRNLKPSRIEVSAPGGFTLKVTFSQPSLSVANAGIDQYELAVNKALLSAQEDLDSGLKGEKWTLTDKSLTVM